MAVVSNRTLLKIASIGGIITCTTGMLYQSSVKNQIRNAPYYKETLKTIKLHHGAVTLLGEPITEGNLDLGNTENYYERDRAHVQVPVKGSKQKGTVYLWAKKPDGEEWIVHRIELGLQNEPNRRLLVKDIGVSNSS